jgi:octaprenyl-diphosphate synthase
LREHKVTLPLIHAFQAMNSAERKTVEHFFADPQPDDRQINQIIELVRLNGGLEYARQKAGYFGETAAAALLELPASAATEALRDAVAYVIERRN